MFWVLPSIALISGSIVFLTTTTLSASQDMVEPAGISVVETAKPQARTPGFEEPGCLKARVDFWQKVYTELDQGQAYVVREPSMEILEKISWPDDKKIKKKTYRALISKYGEDTFKIQSGIQSRFEAGYNRYESGTGKIVHEQFKKFGLPPELALLPHVESSYNTNAVSSAKATGLFQIMPFWVKPLGLKNTAQLKDPAISSLAAAKLFAIKKREVGDYWPLVVTSWNQGVNSMNNARASAGEDICRVVEEYDGRRFGYAGRNFFASLLAVLRIVESRSSKTYGEFR